MSGHENGAPSAELAGVKRALAGFAVLGRQETLAGGRLRAFTVPGWVAPSFSPVVYTASGPPTPEVLQAVRSVWGRPERAGRRTPCFLLPCTPERPLPLEVSGWHADPRPLRVIVEPVARPGTRAEQAHAGVGVHALGTDEDEREFLELVGRCFPDVAGRPLLVTAPLRAAGVRTEVLTIREPGDGRLLAASAQSTRGGTAFQTWGSVDPTRRGEGLSRALQHVALHRAGSCGASGSVTVTRNPRVTGTRRPCVPMWIYEQESP